MNAMAFRLFGGGRGGKIIAVADIGSGSAGFGIFQVPSHGPAIALAAERAVLPIEERTPQAAIAAIAAELTKVGQKVIAASAGKTGGKPRHPELLVCVIRAPWTNAEAVREGSHFEKEMTVTGPMISELAKKTLARATTVDQAHFLDANVARVELNGYPTKKPEGKKANELAVTSLISGCDPDIRASIERALEGILPHTPRQLRGGARTLLTVLREYASQQDYVAVDMGGEGSAMTVVRDGAPSEQILVPEGVYTILRRISTTGIPEETLSLMRMLAREECSGPACDSTLQALARVEPELVKIFGEAMAKCAATRKIPNNFFLVTHPDMADWLAKFFSRIDFTQFTRTAQPYAVRVLAPKDMSAWVSEAPGVVLDCGLAVGGALVNIEENA